MRRVKAETDKEDGGDGKKRRVIGMEHGAWSEERGDKKAVADDRGYKVQPASVSR